VKSDNVNADDLNAASAASSESISSGSGSAGDGPPGEGHALPSAPRRSAGLWAAAAVAVLIAVGVGIYANATRNARELAQHTPGEQAAPDQAENEGIGYIEVVDGDHPS